MDNRIQELRKENNWSQSDLAKISNVKLSTIQKLEGGFNDINMARFKTLYALAKAFDISVEYLVGVSNKR